MILFKERRGGYRSLSHKSKDPFPILDFSWWFATALQKIVENKYRFSLVATQPFKVENAISELIKFSSMFFKKPRNYPLFTNCLS